MPRPFELTLCVTALIVVPLWLGGIRDRRRADDEGESNLSDALNVRRCGLCHGDQLHRHAMCLVCKTGAEPYMVSGEKGD